MVDRLTIKEFLEKKNIFAVVGASGNKNKYGYKIYKELKDSGYKVYPVNPNASEIDGDKCYPSLSKLPEKPDVVDIVTSPRVTEMILKECKKLGIKKVWMQQGSESESAINFCLKNDMEAIYNACIMLERKKVK